MTQDNLAPCYSVAGPAAHTSNSYWCPECPPPTANAGDGRRVAEAKTKAVLAGAEASLAVRHGETQQGSHILVGARGDEHHIGCGRLWRVRCTPTPMLCGRKGLGRLELDESKARSPGNSLSHSRSASMSGTSVSQAGQAHAQHWQLLDLHCLASLET